LQYVETLKAPIYCPKNETFNQNSALRKMEDQKFCRLC
jgi:hypothetical protein